MSIVVAAIWRDAPVWATPGLIRYFDESEWPVQGYQEVKRITDTSVAEMNAYERRNMGNRRRS